MAEHTVEQTGDAHEQPYKTEKKVLVLGGGAPNSTLMAGALYAFEEREVTFDIVYTSGAGALMGLLYVAPSGKSPQAALCDIVKLIGVSDEIYRVFPVGYKTFYKPGPFTRPLHRWGQLFKLGQFPPRLFSGYLGRQEDTLKRWYHAWYDLWMRNRGNAFQRLYNDWIDFWLAAMNPSDLNPFSKGLCGSFPFLEEMVDFAKLALFRGEFYMNAFNITDQKMEIFAKSDITKNPEIFRAALAMPFIYSPVEVDGKLYIEGADHDPMSFGNLRTRRDNDDVKTVVVLDILSTLEDYIVREPRNVWDAYQISIMAPLVSLADKNMAAFKDWVDEENDDRRKNFLSRRKQSPEGNELTAYILNFEIPKSQRDHLLDWSYSNVSSLWQIGYKTGLEFVDRYSHELLGKPKEEQEPLKPIRRRFETVGGDEKRYQLVCQIQEQLNKEGFAPGEIDGTFGPKTREAVRRFQSREGLEETGDVNMATLEALKILTG